MMKNLQQKIIKNPKVFDEKPLKSHIVWHSSVAPRKTNGLILLCILLLWLLLIIMINL